MLVALGRGGRAALRWSMLGQQQAREFAISAEAVSLPDADCDRGAWPAHSRVLPLPKLSHTMEQGRLMKWLVKPGEKVNTVSLRVSVLQRHALDSKVMCACLLILNRLCCCDLLAS